MKIKPKFQTMTNEQIKASIKKEEKHFGSLMSKVDDTKTTTKNLSKYESITTYRDKNGKELYTQYHQQKGANRLNITLYNFKASDGGYVRFSDNDSDGNIDMMYYSNKDKIPVYQAEDENDDGTFDTAFRNSGPDMAKKFDLKF